MAEEKALDLSALSPVPGSRRRRKRIGFGEGSGNGKTCGKGQKGQRSRAGFGLVAGFEGGQMPLHRRLPKIGFTSRKKVRGVNVYTVLSLKKLVELELSGELTLESLRERGLIRGGNHKVKILGSDALSKKITIEAHAVSQTAKASIEAAGGSVTIVS